MKARYSKHYKISVAQLEWLVARVEELGQAVHVICSERIASLKAATAEDEIDSSSPTA